jgi:hypothetical protein
VSYEQALLIQLIVGTPLVMAAALLFAEFFELPFTTGGRLVPYLRRRFPSSRIHVADPQPFEPGAAVVGE